MKEGNKYNTNTNSSYYTIDTTNENLISDAKSEKNEIEEDENEDIIINRVIKSSITTPYDVLSMTKKEVLDYKLIQFDLTFTSAKHKYSWKTYHTPKEIKINIKLLIKNMQEGELKTTKPIHPFIFRINNDQDVLNNLPLITEFYLGLFSEQSAQQFPALTKFFNIGSTSFLKSNGGVKPFEGWSEKKVDKHFCRKCFMIACPCCEICLFKRYHERWVVVHDDHLFYLNDPTQKEGKIVYFFDKDMKIENDGEKSLIINNNSMKLKLRYKNFFEKEYWRNELERRIEHYQLIFGNNKYSAYANMKRFNLCHWFSDGKDYFEDLFQKLMDAKSSIYITDWWMSPEVFLRRPVYDKIYIDMAEKKLLTKDFGQNITRLMDVLDYKCKEGVKIYILIYYEVSLAVTLNSKHTEEVFKKINPNIKVSRHPAKDDFTLMWSHHEKLVIIDQMIGYVGGLDLCWGRYDTKKHPIYEGPNPQSIYEFPLIDYSNARICYFENVDKYWIESVPRKDTMRMPWHDVHSRIIGPAVRDIARHFIERWNHANFSDRKERGLTSISREVGISQNKPNLLQRFAGLLKKKDSIIEKSDNIENPFTSIKSIESKSLKSEELKIGEKENKQLIENFMTGKTKIDDDHLLIRNDTLASLNKPKPNYYSKLIKSMGKMGNQAMTIDEENVIQNAEIYSKYFTPGCTLSEVQVLRSSSEWSAGLKSTENSILQGYYELIENAKHYIYIENQFFVSKSWTDEEKQQCKYSISDIVQNKVAYYLRKRIEKAYYDKEKFRVFVFVPLLPGFAGEPEDSATLQIILKHTYAGICNNHGLSLIEQLYKIMGNKWKNYIGFYSLRNHGIINGVPKTEIIYIHSKLMIVDDTKVLIGSANINDRSLLGNRDSEFAVIIQEKRELINRKNGRYFIMDGKMNYKAAYFATSFRKALMGEHLGIDPNNLLLDDPLSDEFYSFLVGRAKDNTEIYHNIFGCYPDDQFTNFSKLKSAKECLKKEEPQSLMNKYMSLKDGIKGHVVEFPLFFLKEEQLGKSFFSVENLIPEYNFT